MRTLLTIDILGLLDKYQEIFDVNAYYHYKTRFIGKVLGQKSQKAYYQEIYDLMKKNKYPIPFMSKMIAFASRIGLVHIYIKLTGKTGFAH